MTLPGLGESLLPADDNPELPPELGDTSFIPTRERQLCDQCDPDSPDGTKMYTIVGLNMHKARKHREKKPPEGPSAAKIAASIKKAPEKKPATPKSTGRRIPAGEVLTSVVSILGAGLQQTGISIPTGRALRLEAGLLGAELDTAVAGTIIDRQLVQPLVKTKGRFEHIAPLVALPVLTFMLDKNPAMLPTFYPILRATLMQMLPDLVKAKKKELADEEKLRQAAQELGELDPELATLFGDGVDPIDVLIQSLFPVPPEVIVEEPGSAWPNANQSE
jgi:hypothetical protein